MESMMMELAGEDFFNSDLVKQLNITSEDYAMMREIPRYLGVIDHYGCWCYFWEAFGEGYGRPVDEVDMKCKALHQGYECVIKDTQDEIDALLLNNTNGQHDAQIQLLAPCLEDPWRVTYQATAWTLWRDIFEGCVMVNPNDICKQRICSVEIFFILELFSAWKSGYVDNNLKHRNGFNPKAQCGVRHNTQALFTASCCGSYPERFIYRDYDSEGNERQCCGKYPYTMNAQECCVDNSEGLGYKPKPTGQCDVDEDRSLDRLKRSIKREEIEKFTKSKSATGKNKQKEGYNIIEIAADKYKRKDKKVKPRSTLADLGLGKSNKKPKRKPLIKNKKFRDEH